MEWNDPFVIPWLIILAISCLWGAYLCIIQMSRNDNHKANDYMKWWCDLKDRDRFMIIENAYKGLK